MTWKVPYLCRSICLLQSRWGDEIRYLLPWKKYKEAFTLHHSVLGWRLLVLWDAISLLRIICKRDPWRLRFPLYRLVEPCTGIIWCFPWVEKECNASLSSMNPGSLSPDTVAARGKGSQQGWTSPQEYQGSHRPLHTLIFSLCCRGIGA